jgi:hypothetical protein
MHLCLKFKTILEFKAKRVSNWNLHVYFTSCIYILYARARFLIRKENYECIAVCILSFLHVHILVRLHTERWRKIEICLFECWCRRDENVVDVGRARLSENTIFGVRFRFWFWFWNFLKMILDRYLILSQFPLAWFDQAFIRQHSTHLSSYIHIFMYIYLYLYIYCVINL